MLSLIANENHYRLKIKFSQALIVISEVGRIVVVSTKEIGSPPMKGCDC